MAITPLQRKETKRVMRSWFFLSKCAAKYMTTSRPCQCSWLGSHFRPFSSHQSDVRGTIPYLGHGVAIGQSAERERRFSQKEIETFGDLIGDQNILHSSGFQWCEALRKMPHLQAVQDSGIIRLHDESMGSSSTMKPVVHGIFVSSLFSSIFGSLSPGCVYMNQTLQFSNPVHADEVVLAQIEIEKIRKWRRGGVVVQCNTTVSVGLDKSTGTFQTKAVTGTANVWLPSGYQKN